MFPVEKTGITLFSTFRNSVVRDTPYFTSVIQLVHVYINELKLLDQQRSCVKVESSFEMFTDPFIGGISGFMKSGKYMEN